MFHHVTGVPFESQYVCPSRRVTKCVDQVRMTTGGAFDELTLWEQIDAGAQYTPAKKWLTSVPICL